MISDRLKEARIKSNMTKADMARKLGVAYSTYDGYETGYREPKYETLLKIASALEVSIADLLDVKPAHAVDPNETDAEREKRIGMREGALSNSPRAEDVANQYKADMNEAMDKLSLFGQKEAVKRVREMTRLEEYERKSFSDIWNYGNDKSASLSEVSSDGKAQK